MDRMLVVVFETKSKAVEGKKALLQLEADGSVSIYAYAVLAKNANGRVTLEPGDDDGPMSALAGTTLGGLIGLLGGALGAAVGAAAGFAAGGAVDWNNARVGEDFVDDVAKSLTPNRVAIVAEVEEDWTTPVDTRMEAIGGTVYRRALSDVRDTVHQEVVAAMKADLAQMKAEYAQARADGKDKLSEKIERLDSKIQEQLEKARKRLHAAERQAQAKAQILKSKARAAQNDVI